MANRVDYSEDEVRAFELRAQSGEIPQRSWDWTNDLSSLTEDERETTDVAAFCAKGYGLYLAQDQCTFAYPVWPGRQRVISIRGVTAAQLMIESIFALKRGNGNG